MYYMSEALPLYDATNLEERSLNKVVVSYEGVFNMPLINTFVAEIREYLAMLNVDRKNIKGFHSLAVECLENVYKHGKSLYKERKVVEGKFLFGRKRNSLIFILSNTVSAEDAERLSKKFKSIEGLTLPQIKMKYRHELINGKISERGGAGLGIYVMALKCQNYYGYQLEPNDVGSYTYKLIVQIPLKKKA